MLTRPDGTQFLVRPAATTDVGALSELFTSLSIDDQHLRFFSLFHPQPEFYERIVHLGTPNGKPGAALVVETLEGELVAEADYIVLSNGDAEFSIVVARPWRGWLGGALLDTLTELAASNGIPNIEADILVMNHRMLGVMRTRGYAYMDHADLDTVRVIASTDGAVPTWPPTDDRPRLLVEMRGGHWLDEEDAAAAGFNVITCAGPEARRDADTPTCPALDGSGAICPLAAGADVILCSLPACDSSTKPLIAAHARLHGDVPLYERIENLYALIEMINK